MKWSRIYWRHSGRHFVIHVRNKLLTGALVAAPLVVLVGAVSALERHAQPMAELVGFDFPGLGLLLVLSGLYLFGAVITSVAGRWALRRLDWLLEHVPGVNLLYTTWKHFLVLPHGDTNVFHQVVMLPAADGKTAQLAFCSGKPIPGDAHTYCLFVPNAPNPLAGRLQLVRRDGFVPLALSVEEAFKWLISTGNYVPEKLPGLSIDTTEEQG